MYRERAVAPHRSTCRQRRRFDVCLSFAFALSLASFCVPPPGSSAQMPTVQAPPLLPSPTTPPSPIPSIPAPSPSATEQPALIAIHQISDEPYLGVCRNTQADRTAAPIYSLFLLSLDGASIGQLTDGICYDSDISLDRSFLAFRELRFDAFADSRVGIMETASLQNHWLPIRGDCTEPSFSPDGAQLAVVCDQNIHLVDLQTTSDIVVADCVAEDKSCGDPQWSPDGSQITFFKGMEFTPNPGLYSVDVTCADDPSTCPKCTRYLIRGTSPHDWAPNGDTVAFITFEGDIGLARPNGYVFQQLPIPELAQVHSLAWSPAGDQIAINMNTRSDGLNLYIVQARTAQITQVTFSGEDTLQFWIPMRDSRQ